MTFCTLSWEWCIHATKTYCTHCTFITFVHFRYAVHYNDDPDPGIWCGDLGTAQVQLSRQAYYASVAFVDEWIGYIMTALTEKGLLENTFVMFTADHGDMMGDHYHWRKGYPYLGSARIPMLLRWPNTMDHSNGGRITTPRGSVKTEVVELRDILPTFLDAANIETSNTLNGTSLLDLLTTPDVSSTTWRSYIDLEHDICYNITNHWNALTDGHFKYIFQAYFGDEQLFDLDSDPKELNNLAGNASYKATLQEWRSRMVEQFIAEGRGADWVDEQTLQLKQRIKGNFTPHTTQKAKYPFYNIYRYILLLLVFVYFNVAMYVRILFLCTTKYGFLSNIY